MEEGEEERLLENTIEEERLQVCQMARRLGSKLSGLMIACGFLILVFGIYLIIEPPDPVLSVRLIIIFIGILGFLGALNIL